MSIFRVVVFVAAVAGLVAGLVMTALQSFYTVPLILQAEAFEDGKGAHDHIAPAIDAPEPAEADHQHVRDEGAWAPADGFERTALTGLANIVTGIGFALLLVTVSEFVGGISNWREGLFWGFAGFAIFTLAPGLGLPPELPAMPAADLLARQVWWIAAASATAVGLGLIAFRRSTLVAIVGVMVIVAPHIIGAPQPESRDSPIPADLHHQFVVAVTVTNLVFWLLLGGAVGVIRPRFARGFSEPQSRLA